MKRAIGAAALGGGLLALSAGVASAQDVSADVSANLGRSTSAEVRVCADGRVLSGRLGSCRRSGTSASAQAGASGIRVRARVPRTAQADVTVGTRRTRPSVAASGQASATPRSRSASASADASADTSLRARADASASLTRRAGRLLDLDATASLAGVGLLGSSPFTLVGDPATDNLLPIGELTLDGLTGETPAGIGVLDSGPIASGNQVGVDAGDVSPSVPVTICGNGVGVLGDASASCTPGQPATPNSGSSGAGSTGTSAGTGTATSDSLLDNLASGNQVDAGIGDISPSVPVMVCGNGVGVLGDASAGCGAGQPAAPNSGSSDSSASGTSSATQADGTLAANQVDASVGDISPSVPVTVCGNSVGALGDASASCGTGQSAGTGGTSAGSDGSGSTGASAGTGDPGSGSLLDDIASGNQVDAGIGSISPSVPVTVCGNSVGLLADASAGCGSGQPASSNGGASAGASGSTQADGTLAGNQVDASVDDVSATVPMTASCNSVGLLGDASSSCGTSSTTDPGNDTNTGTVIDIGTPGPGAGTDTGIGVDIGVDIGTNTGTDTSTGGIIAPPPGTTSPGGTDANGTPGSTGTSGIAGTFGSTGTSGIAGTLGSTGTSGIAGALGLTLGSGGTDGSVTTFAPLRPSAAGTGALPFTGAASDLLALVAFGLLVPGALVVRATRPAAAREGGDDR